MYRVGNKIVKFGSKIPISQNTTVIEIECEGTSFPDRIQSAAVTFGGTTGKRACYIDFADGTGLHLFETVSFISTIAWYYQDLNDPEKIGTIDPSYQQRRTVKIFPLYPASITVINFQNHTLYGKFPQNTGNYNLVELRLSGVARIETFPERFRGGSITLLVLSNISQTPLNYVPDWIGNSRIVTLRLSSVLNLNRSSLLTNVDVISRVAALKVLFIDNNGLSQNSFFPETLKNATTLEEVYIANNFTVFPARIGECGQIKKLVIGEAGNGYSNSMSSWGAGVGLMISLVSLIYDAIGQGSDILETKLPNGIENCLQLKIISFNATFKSQARMDTHVNNWYDFIVANASLSTGNAKFRNMSFRCNTNVGPYQSFRPSGGTTPTGVVEPPATPLQKVYNLCKKYGHTWSIKNLANNGTEIIAP